MRDDIRAETVSISGHAGDQIEAYLAQPLDQGSYGGVVVIHHMPGFDEWIKEVTRKFAAHGYLAICPNLYSRGARGQPGRRRGRGQGEGWGPGRPSGWGR